MLMFASPKLSKTSKMPAKSWSLPAWETCPGARDDNGKPVDACGGCYALTGAYQFPGTIASREHNLADWKHSDWVAVMVASMKRAKFFRWFDSGDAYSVDLIRKIHEVVKLTPHVQHWLPTRSYKVAKLWQALEAIDAEPNCVVRCSSDSIDGERLSGYSNDSVILGSAEDFIPEKGYSLCRAYTRGGKCGDCRACWSKAVQTVAYPKHGKRVNPKQFEKDLYVV